MPHNTAYIDPPGMLQCVCCVVLCCVVLCCVVCKPAVLSASAVTTGRSHTKGQSQQRTSVTHTGERTHTHTHTHGAAVCFRAGRQDIGTRARARLTLRRLQKWLDWL